jgi:hypothetical protein
MTWTAQKMTHPTILALLHVYPLPGERVCLAVSQHKTKKKFTNLCYHEDDFSMAAERQSFAMSRVKGARDGNLWEQ